MADYTGPLKGRFYEISLLKVPFGLLVMALGVAVAFVGVAIIALLKLIPVIFQGYADLTRRFMQAPKLPLLLFPFTLTVLVCWPAVCIALCVLAPVLSAFLGALCIKPFFDEDVRMAAWTVYDTVRSFDILTNNFICDESEKSCIPVWVKPPSRHPQPASRWNTGTAAAPVSHAQTSATGAVSATGKQPARRLVNSGEAKTSSEQSGVSPDKTTLVQHVQQPVSMRNVFGLMATPQDNVLQIDTLWDSFFEACTTTTGYAITKGYVTAGDVSAEKPYLTLGIPALTIFRGLTVRVWDRLHKTGGLNLMILMMLPAALN